MEKNNRNEGVENLRQSIGVTAEMALLFMRASIGAGATTEEAARTTQAFLGAIIYGRPNEKPKE